VDAERPGRTRIRLDLGYDGSRFSGWAAQPGRRTVEGVLTEALARVLRCDVADVHLVVAGRTDAGVHASGQVCHVDVAAQPWLGLPGRSDRTPAQALLRRLAGVLPEDVRVHACALAPPGFDARFSAAWRRYAYRVCDHPAGVPPLRRFDVLARPRPPDRPLDIEAMDAAAAPLIGLHDFAAYCRRRDGATTIRDLREFAWRRCPDGLVEARVLADAFCHSMVRALVGAAIAVGEGRRPPTWPADVLTARERDPGVAVAPALGLTLAEVGYPPPALLAERAEQARAVRTLPM
jgi:tRNA pseudouridine38-40 synthase